jgi:hypothetical protein
LRPRKEIPMQLSNGTKTLIVLLSVAAFTFAAVSPVRALVPGIPNDPPTPHGGWPSLRSPIRVRRAASPPSHPAARPNESVSSPGRDRPGQRPTDL